MLIVGYESPPFEGGWGFSRLQLLEKQLNLVGIVKSITLRRPWKDGSPPPGFCRDSPKMCTGLERLVACFHGSKLKQLFLFKVGR